MLDKTWHLRDRQNSFLQGNPHLKGKSLTFKQIINLTAFLTAGILEKKARKQPMQPMPFTFFKILKSKGFMS